MNYPNHRFGVHLTQSMSQVSLGKFLRFLSFSYAKCGGLNTTSVNVPGMREEEKSKWEALVFIFPFRNDYYSVISQP